MTNIFKTLVMSVTLLVALSFDVQAQTLLDGKKWTDVNIVGNGGGGTIQGAAYHNGNIYQFTNQGGGHGVYNVEQNSWSAGGALNNGYLAKSHFGSACFGPESTKTYTVNGTQLTSAYPLLYVTAHDKTSGSRALLVNVVDYERRTLVASIRLKDTGSQDDQIAAYDFAGGKLYLMGYVGNVVGMAPWVIREYSGFSFNNFTTTSQTVETIENVPVVDMTSATYTTTQVGGPNSEGIQENLVAGTLQDCQYVDGKIYFVVTRGSRYSRTEWMRVHCYDVATKQVVKTVCSAVNCEPEGFVYDGNGSFYVTTGGEGTEGKSRLFKLSEGSGYDALNFEPAPLVDGYYQISNASQFVWFKQQVYSGCTTIKAKLMNDISMSGQKDPYTYYVYDTSAESGSAQKFDATYAFRGEFDGQSHNITGVSITSTPHNNAGLFPYCVSANIHDLGVAGTITATQNVDKSASGQEKDIMNVGMIGTMNGGTLENIKVYDLTVSVADGLTSENVGTLIGREIGTVTKTNCLTEDPSKKTHEQNGGEHYYVNGFCSCSDATKNEDGYYEAPELITAERCTSLGISQDYYTNGYYEVKNAGNMFWISKNFSSSNYNRNYVMTADIDMAGDDANHQDWAGIGAYDSNTKTSHFCGTFDGNGHRFTNFYMKVNASWKAIFNLTNAGAVIKNFSIDGQVDINGGGQIGVIVGRVQGTTKLEDIHSGVNLTVASGKIISAIGGIIGQVAGETNLNRCRYSGTITGNSSYNALGGIIGNGENPITVNNCLFDGTISTTATQARTGVDNGIKIGGICGRNNNKTTITNSMSRGTISVPDAADKGNVGVIMGTQINTNKLTITNTYYSAISGIDAVGNNSNTDKSTANPTAITNETPLSLRMALGQENWKFVDPITEYPVPGTGGPILQVVTITFDTKGGSAITPISGVEGTPVTAPADPTKTGYTFGGWDPAVPTTMPESDMTCTAQWNVLQFTISFNTNGGTPASIEPITADYGTTITAPDDPTREGYDFDGWNPAIPTTMPGESITCVAQWSQETYTNGFNDNWSTCAESKKYEAPKLIKAERCTELGIDVSYVTNGYYEVKNAGNMFWISKNFSSIENTRKFVMTSDIDMEGNNANHKDWEGIAYQLSGNTFQGVFDGLGHKFTNYYLKITYNNNVFNYKSLFGLVTNATIKNFSIDGQVDIYWQGSQYGSVVGRVHGGTSTIEDIYSTVNFTVYEDKAASSIGGIVGQSSGTTNVNRCRYNGTITGNSACAGLGGIVGNGEGAINIDNCLFDGTITTTAKETRTGVDDGIKIGGLCGRNKSATKITNSMSIGTITVTPSEGSFDGTNSNVGIIMGTQTQSTLTITNTFYSTSNCTTGIGTVGNNSSSDKTKAAPTELAASPDWATICTTLGKNNWVIDQTKYGKEYPVPAVSACEHDYNALGYCTKCQGPEPIGEPVAYPDGKSYYHIDHFADLTQFAHMVNNSANGTILNAKVTEDIDLTGSSIQLTTTIGDATHHYCGTFDGQGHTIKGVDVTSDQRYVGLFACVGIKDSDATKVKDGIVKNFSVKGNIKATYFSQWDTNTPLVMGVIGEVYSGTVENVHSSVNFSCTSGTRVHIGGVVGGSLHSEGDAGTIEIKNCSYTGTIDVNASDCIGGIVGYAQHKTWISNTLFAGSINQNYTRNANEQDGGSEFAQGKVSTYIGGVLGYCDSNSNGVQNSIIVGEMSSNLTILYGDPKNPKSQMVKGNQNEGKNNMNICVGYDGQIVNGNSSENYYGNYITQEMKDKGYHQLPTSNFENTAKIHPETDFISGLVCARINAESTDDNKNPWGQILGYQVGYKVNDELVRENTDGSTRYDPKSPAQKYPIPGYTNPEKKTYNVVKDAQNDYTADYYFFDDYGDTTPFPSDAASMKVKKIQHTRLASYMQGYCSVVLPFALTPELLPQTSDLKLYHYGSCDSEQLVVTFKAFDADTYPEAGEPFIMYVGQHKQDWAHLILNENGTPLALDVTNPADNGNGLYGSFNTGDPIGTGFWKLNANGSELVYTLSYSHCYPYRCYLKLPYVYNPETASQAPERYTIVFEDETEAIAPITTDALHAPAPCYNLQGQPVRDTSRPGLYIRGGRAVMIR